MKVFLIVIALLIPPTTILSAAELTWHFQSEYPYTVDVELYSASRSHVWPGNGKVWILDDYEQYDITITCQSGEKICYGAWSRGNPSSAYWGVGPNNRHGCDDCCSTCGGGDTPLRTLVE